MVEHLSQEEIHNFREAFDFIDKDGDGTISVGDLSSVMKMLGQPVEDDDLEQMIKQADSSGSGNIFFPDFLELLSQHITEKPNDEEDILDCLQALDINGNGVIKVEVLRGILSNLLEHVKAEELDCVIQQCRTDNEGFIDYKDFVKKITTGGLIPGGHSG